MKKLLVISSLLVVSPVFAAADATIDTLVANNALTWALVKGGMIGIGGFLVAYSFFKRINRA